MATWKKMKARARWRITGLQTLRPATGSSPSCFLLSGQYMSPRSVQRFRDNDMRQNKDLKRIA
ncbi:hypothetical protein FJW10_14520 [Mesorhizobium sp. B4-1-1]|nr:hypothetical protein FJW10_14520 [Mesorhizobium sp. B4-1-1]